MVKSLVNKPIFFDLITLSGVIALIWFLFNLNRATLIFLIPACIIAYLLATYYPKNLSETIPLYVISGILGASISYVFGLRTNEVASVILGINLVVLFKYYKNKVIDLESVALINVITISSLIFLSAIQKFRGANNLDTQNVNLFILTLVLSFVATYFLAKSINNLTSKKKIKMYSLTIITFVGILLIFLGTYFIFKEAGYGIIFVPIVSGIAASLFGLFDKKGNPISEIIEIFILIIYPYASSGIAGIALSILTYLLYKIYILKTFELDGESLKNTALKISPLIFLLGVVEIRENLGLITRFNIMTGYQIGWLLISAIIFKFAYKYKESVMKILEENEIIKFSPLVLSIFTILLLTLIIRFGRSEALSSLLLVSSIFLLITDSEALKKYQDRITYILSLTFFIGAVAFYALARI